MTRSQTGFTLVELMIVATVVSIIAGIAVPNLLSSKSVANQRAVVSSLKTLMMAQSQIMANGASDADRDGRGEALALDQLAGLRILASGATLPTPPLPTSLGMIGAAGLATKHGYLIALYLPDAAGNAVLASAANQGAIDLNLSETSWSCVAWPMRRGRTGTSTFFVNQQSEILVAADAAYDGPSTVPPGGAALVGVGPNVLVGGSLAIDVAGADGNVWRLLR
jgi:prepilin-type N-terminal cleavage/methylation domain-containing protein